MHMFYQILVRVKLYSFDLTWNVVPKLSFMDRNWILIKIVTVEKPLIKTSEKSCYCDYSIILDSLIY